MSHTETPPSYEELFPQSDLPPQLLQSQASNPPPARLLARFTGPAPHHATYFSLEKSWAEGAGYYRGNQSQLLSSPDTSRGFSASLYH